MSSNGIAAATNAGLTQAVVSLNSNSLRDIPIATSSPLPLGTSAAGIIAGNGGATMAAVLAGSGAPSGSHVVAAQTSQSGATSSSSSTQQAQVASGSQTQPQTSVENYQFLLPRIFEPSLTEDEIQQREKERAER